MTVPDFDRIQANLDAYMSGTPEPLLDNAGDDTAELLAYAHACRWQMEEISCEQCPQCMSWHGSHDAGCAIGTLIGET